MWLDPDLYDIENPEDPPFDLAFWERMVRDVAPRRMLELAAGTGRLTLPLARLGIARELVALDLSEPFLGRLREKLAAEDEPVRQAVTVVSGPMQDPPLDGPFDLIVIPFNSLAYLIEPADRLACVRAVGELLAPGGTFAFDLVQPRYDFLHESAEPCPPLRVDLDHAAPQHGVTRVMRSYSDVYDATTQTLRSTNRYEIHYATGRVDHRITDLDWHIYFPAELDALLELAGLRVTERFGGWHGEPWGPASRRMLWVCEAA